MHWTVSYSFTAFSEKLIVQHLTAGLLKVRIERKINPHPAHIVNLWPAGHIQTVPVSDEVMAHSLVVELLVLCWALLSVYLQKQWSWSVEGLDILSLYYIPLNIAWHRFANHYIGFLFRFYTASNFFGIVLHCALRINEQRCCGGLQVHTIHRMLFRWAQQQLIVVTECTDEGVGRELCLFATYV